MNKLEELLKEQAVLIVDGALGTRLQTKGLNINDSLWSAKLLDENPNAIKAVHKEYLDSGADLIITSSYQASIEGFEKKGFSRQKAKELICLSIELARKARDEFWEEKKNKKKRIKPLVAASIGPYGAFLANGAEYTGKYNISKEQLKNFHKRRVEIIASTNPDIFAIETIPSFEEAKILAEILKEYKNIPSWICFSAKDNLHINDGTKIKECAKYLDTKEQISAIGINCTSPKYISSLIKEIKSVSNKPIVVYPNGGFKYNPLTKNWEDAKTDEKEFAKMAHLWKTQGAKLIGGCCQTEPKEIEELRRVLLS
ncbi:homocysteine S-methyltransferase [Halarcobacter anaerophilus]|uniref:S-methylmethionine:homocysteine methyltransferase n=1 Tax=Halarcobacter anaerophilus TaxID=877500 RepID=A0A4V1LPH5_9BACT|nr:homocysteine S-methyltransferase [Halarcobacter anaerophilus]QDF30291.1 homocysteine S-methyltransferase [Halarcobacter anaerophilus]RXJ61218.1 homocysteine S-methyltransferase [Halarcobacter anaerophilus]